MKIELDYIRN